MVSGKHLDRCFINGVIRYSMIEKAGLKERVEFMDKVLEHDRLKMKAESRGRSQAGRVTLDAMFVALTLVFTAFVNIQIPGFGGAGGLIHLGNVPLFVAAIVYGKRTGATAGALGMGLFDILSGWTAWAPCTIIICGLMGFAVGAVCKNRKSMLSKGIAIAVALFIKTAGYFIFESFIMGNGMAAAFKSIPGNIIQVAVAAIIVFIMITPLERGLQTIEG